MSTLANLHKSIFSYSARELQELIRDIRTSRRNPIKRKAKRTSAAKKHPQRQVSIGDLFDKMPGWQQKMMLEKIEGE